MKNRKEEIKHVFHVSEEGNLTPHAMVRGSAVAEIPPGVYSLVVEVDPPNIFLRPENNFRLPDRIYGNTKITGLVERFVKSYEMNDKNLGIALIGEKGSGKTLLLKALSAKVVEMGLPVILIDEKVPGAMLNWFLSTITQQVLINFDEFEKVYDEKEDQTAILKLLDGTNTGAKKMYCFTLNDRDGVSEYMFGRPSRIRYVLPFKRLEISTVVDYVQANLKDCTEAHLRAFIHLALCDGKNSNGMNFDSMVEFVKEMNQFGGDVKETLGIMGENGVNSWSYFEVSGFENGQRVHHVMTHGEHFGPYIGVDGMEACFRVKMPLTDQDREEGMVGELKDVWITLTEKDFVSFGDTYDMLVFEKDGITYHLKYCEHEAARKISSSIEAEESQRGKRPGARLTPTKSATGPTVMSLSIGRGLNPSSGLSSSTPGNPSYGTNG
jgi:hypothetical protein